VRQDLVTLKVKSSNWYFNLDATKKTLVLGGVLEEE
jgi:hypothetical protein